MQVSYIIFYFKFNCSLITISKLIENKMKNKKKTAWPLKLWNAVLIYKSSLSQFSHIYKNGNNMCIYYIYMPLLRSFIHQMKFCKKKYIFFHFVVYLILFLNFKNCNQKFAILLEFFVNVCLYVLHRFVYTWR